MTDKSRAEAGRGVGAPDRTAQVSDRVGQVANSSDRVRQLFDAKAATWAAKYAPDGRLASRARQFTGALLEHVSPGGRILDLGCGTGELARVLTASGWPVTACDISEQMLHRAVARDQGGAVKWVRLEPGWRTLPFAPASFDAVVAASVLEYVDSPSDVLRECARVLRPGGVALCTVPDIVHPIRWLEWLVAVAGRLPLAPKVGESWPILGCYLAYLQVSRQRHCRKWWCTVAARAGLIAVAHQANARKYSPLRLLTFERPFEMRDCS